MLTKDLVTLTSTSGLDQYQHNAVVALVRGQRDLDGLRETGATSQRVEMRTTQALDEAEGQIKAGYDFALQQATARMNVVKRDHTSRHVDGREELELARLATEVALMTDGSLMQLSTDLASGVIADYSRRKLAVVVNALHLRGHHEAAAKLAAVFDAGPEPWTGDPRWVAARRERDAIEKRSQQESRALRVKVNGRERSYKIDDLIV